MKFLSGQASLDFPSTAPQKKIEFSFQEIGIEMEKVYGKKVWALFHDARYTEVMIRDAFTIAQKRGITTYPYLRGILKSLSKEGDDKFQ